MCVQYSKNNHAILKEGKDVGLREKQITFERSKSDRQRYKKREGG